MTEIKDRVVKEQINFFNKCVFHPTDAIEDPWGKRILDRMAADGAVDTVRIYSMFEDIVYTDSCGKLAYDFRLCDLRLDYLVSKGYNLVIAFAGIPECISSGKCAATSVSKNKTRYKGKMWNTNPPADYAVWEEICYEYTKHITERYGEKTVAGWRFHCFNEADIEWFFMNGIPARNLEVRCEAYLSLYESFVRGVRRAHKSVRVGGPALASVYSFLEYFLTKVKERGIELNYISFHTYGTTPDQLNSGEETLSVSVLLRKIYERISVIEKCGFSSTPIVIDEWGAASHGFFNSEECKILMFRETEINSAYFIRLISELIKSGLPIESLMICLSGQHEMVEDFTGFRNFFTLNFIAKPIYNAYILTSKLHTKLLEYKTDTKNLDIIPTKSDTGAISVALTYAAEDFSESVQDVNESLHFENIVGKKVTVWCIDRKNTNPYRTWCDAGEPEISGEVLDRLREEGNMKPKECYIAEKDEVNITLTANSVYLITVE